MFSFARWPVTRDYISLLVIGRLICMMTEVWPLILLRMLDVKAE